MLPYSTPMTKLVLGVSSLPGNHQGPAGLFSTGSVYLRKCRPSLGKAPAGVTALPTGVWDTDTWHLEAHRPEAKSHGCFLKDLQSQMQACPPRGFLRGNLQVPGQESPSATMPGSASHCSLGLSWVVSQSLTGKLRWTVG